MIELVGRENCLAPRVKVVGIGGGGGNAVNAMITSGLQGVEFLAADTDAQALATNLAPTKLKLGERGLGAGGNAEAARAAAVEHRDTLREPLSGADLVFVIAAMGGGTGTGAAPVIGHLARETGALAIAAITIPFEFEGKRRIQQANDGIEELLEAVDTLILIPSQRLLSVAGRGTMMLDAFRMADELVLEAVQCLSDLITIHGLINLDLADVRTIVTNRGAAFMGVGTSSGEARAIQAARLAISSPLMEGVSIGDAKGVIINITGSHDLSLHEVNEAASLIYEETHADANVLFGAVIDETLGENLRVSLLATGFDLRRGSSAVEDRLAAARKHLTVLVRQAAGESDLTALPHLLADLPHGEEGFLAEIPNVLDGVARIARAQMALNAADRPFLRESTAMDLVQEIKAFQHQAAGFRYPLWAGLTAAATEWIKKAQRQLDEVRKIMKRDATLQVFRAGDPVDLSKEAFVLRASVVGEIDRQISLATGCPGLLIYGRRRMGKSTLVLSLNAFLPSTVAVAYLSMQDPQAFESTDSLVSFLAAPVGKATGIEEVPVPKSLSGLMRFLNTANSRLSKARRRLIIAVDEYEQMDVKIGESVFSLDVLATLRESIQKHRQIIWALIGSHHVTELVNAPWSSYLVSVRLVEVPPFTREETRLLLTQPLKHSDRWGPDDPERPRFDETFWGQNGIDEIHEQASGWPHLVQLIAETLVDLVNDRGAQHVDRNLMDAALNKAVISGDTVFRQLMEMECSVPEEWEYLSAFRSCDLQPPPRDERIRRSLRHRLLISEESRGWRLRVPLMVRWLRERA